MLGSKSDVVKPNLQLVQDEERRGKNIARIPIVLDFDFYVKPFDYQATADEEIKHSSHTTEISSVGFSFLYPSKPSLEYDTDRTGCITKNALLDIFLYFEGRRFRFSALRIWAKEMRINDTLFFCYGARWCYPNANQEIALKYIIETLKDALKKSSKK